MPLFNSTGALSPLAGRAPSGFNTDTGLDTPTATAQSGTFSNTFQSNFGQPASGSPTGATTFALSGGSPSGAAASDPFSLSGYNQINSSAYQPPPPQYSGAAPSALSGAARGGADTARSLNQTPISTVTPGSDQNAMPGGIGFSGNETSGQVTTTAPGSPSVLAKPAPAPPAPTPTSSPNYNPVSQPGYTGSNPATYYNPPNPYGSTPFMSNPTGVSVNGTPTPFNPQNWATPATAAQVAKMVGGTVFDNSVGNPVGSNQSQWMIKLANGQILNPGAIAQLYQVGDASGAPGGGLNQGAIDAQMARILNNNAPGSTAIGKGLYTVKNGQATYDPNGQATMQQDQLTSQSAYDNWLVRNALNGTPVQRTDGLAPLAVNYNVPGTGGGAYGPGVLGADGLPQGIHDGSQQLGFQFGVPSTGWPQSVLNLAGGAQVGQAAPQNQVSDQNSLLQQLASYFQAFGGGGVSNSGNRPPPPGGFAGWTQAQVDDYERGSRTSPTGGNSAPLNTGQSIGNMSSAQLLQMLLALTGQQSTPQQQNPLYSRSQYPMFP